MDNSNAAVDLRSRRCEACSAQTPRLTQIEIEQLLKAVPKWQLADGELVRTFKFPDFYQTMAFVNAVAWVAHGEDHHPDLHVGYNRCAVRYSTHAIGGLSQNDFICAAKIDALI